MANRLLFVKSIEKPSVQGVSEWISPSTGKKIKKTKIGRSRTTLMAQYSPRVGGLLNGLSYKKWIEKGEQKLDSQGNPLTLQDKLEQKWGLSKGYLTNSAWQRPEYTKKNSEKLTFYQSHYWTLRDGTTVFNLDTMEGDLFQYVAQDSKKIAPSLKAYQEHKFPYAEFYIAFEREEEEDKYTKNKRKAQALAFLADASFTPTWQEKFVIVLDLASALTPVATENAFNLLSSFVEGTSWTAGSNIDKLEELVEKFKTKTGKQEISTRFLLKRAEAARVVQEKGDSYTWIGPNGSIELGATLQEAINWLENPKKETLVEKLKEEVEAKLGK